MKVVVALSGGVDSAVAAALLKQQGYEVIGLYLKMRPACGAQRAALADARAVAKVLGVPLRVETVARDFERTVVAPFVSAYAAGRTPNPCVVCNPRLKIAALAQVAARERAAFFATGHYAKVKISRDGSARLFKADDFKKDQSYFLAFLKQNQLRRLLLPLAEFTKVETRALAGRFGLPVSAKKDSQEICFVQDGDWRGFLATRLPERSGELVEEETGAVLGRHAGVAYFTLGQRQGLGLAGGPWFVVGLKAKKNIVLLSRDEKKLWRDNFFVKKLTWISGEFPAKTWSGQVRVRYGAEEKSCHLVKEGARWLVQLKSGERAITPGQSAVFYRGSECFGAGEIV